jgi:hypothetical protein
MRRPLQATLYTAVLVGCQQPFGFIGSFTPTNFVPAAEQPLTSQLKAIRAIQPGMPIREVEVLLSEQDFTCVYVPDALPEPHLDACPSQPGQSPPITLLARIYYQDGRVTHRQLVMAPSLELLGDGWHPMGFSNGQRG